MRRLPVYILIDTSESMIGEALESAQAGLKQMIASLRRNPYALETVALSVISFNSCARVLTPLTDLIDFQPPKLELRPGTALGAAFDLLRERINLEVKKTTVDVKGDWRPLVFVISDGMPTDDWRPALERFRAIRPKPALVYALGCGEEVDHTVFKEVADARFRLNPRSEEELPELFKNVFIWLSSSVQSVSQGVADDFLTKEDAQLPEGVERIGDDYRPPQSTQFPRQIFLRTTCSTTHNHALVRLIYDEELEVYTRAKIYKLDSNFDNDEAGYEPPPVPIERIMVKLPDCPYCSNVNYIFCGCGAVYCEKLGVDYSVCPVCHIGGDIGGGGGFDVRNSAG